MTGPVQPGTGRPPPELDEELEDEDELEELELLLDDDDEDDEEELLDEDEEDELEDELDEELEDELDEELELLLLLIEHSLTPPAMRPPKVASLHTKLPLSTL